MDISNKSYSTKQRAVRIVVFVLILLVLLCVFDYLSYFKPTADYFNKVTHLSGGQFGYIETIAPIDKLMEEDGKTILVLGDSVANQMLESHIGHNGKYQIRPTNRAVTFIGQYVYIKIFLEHHPEATDVYIMMYSGTLASDIDSNLAYQYVAMPLIDYGYEDDIDDFAMDKLKKSYGSFFLKKDVIKYINESGLNRYLYLKAAQKYNELFVKQENKVVSDITVDYLKKIYDLCNESGVNIHLVSTPLIDTPERRNDCEVIKQVFKENGFDTMFPGYTESFIFFDPELFMDDAVHFKEELKKKAIMDGYLHTMIDNNVNLSGLVDLLSV